MDQKDILKLIDIQSLPIHDSIKSIINTEVSDITFKLKPSTTESNIKHNVIVIKEIRSILDNFSKEYGLDFTKVTDVFDCYCDSTTINKSVKEDAGLPEPLIHSLIFKHQVNSVIRLNQSINYEQVKNLTRVIFRDSPNNPLIFAIPDKDRIEGKVIGEIEQKKVKLPVAWKIQINNKEKESVSYVPYVFGEKIPKRAKIVDEISGEFFLYRFLSKDSKEYALISTSELKLDDYTIHGLSVEVEDFKVIGDAYKLINKFPVFFVHTETSHICKIKSHKELFSKVQELKLTGNKLYDYLSSHKKKDHSQILEHPRWFMKLIASFLFHKGKGTTTEYPLHLLWIADRGTGKSSLLEAMQQKSGESQDIIAGSSSTLKYLIPSFKESNRPEMGALAKASRLVIVDEFFRILRLNIKEKEDECGRMNDLLEHKERQAGSGQGKIKTSMTARLIAATNPIAGTNNIVNLIEKFDDSFLSRFLIYYQSDEHIKFIHNKMKTGTRTTKEWIDVNDFLSIQDYLRSFDVIYKRERVVKIFEKFLIFLNSETKGMYEARYLHHLECLLDGLVKLRCLITRDDSFSATNDDYTEVEAIWARLIKSWFRQNIDDLITKKDLDIEIREKFLPEEGAEILRILANLGYRAGVGVLKEKCRKEMHQVTLGFNLSLLQRGDFIKQIDNEVFHYKFVEVTEE